MPKQTRLRVRIADKALAEWLLSEILSREQLGVAA
jgi:hypothetical protein